MEMTALLALEFDASVDRISRQMFDEKFAAMGWVRHDGMACAWKLEFEERNTDATRLGAVQNMLGIALAGARIEAASVRAAVQFGTNAPATVTPAPQQQRR